MGTGPLPNLWILCQVPIFQMSSLAQKWECCFCPLGHELQFLNQLGFFLWWASFTDFKPFRNCLCDRRGFICKVKVSKVWLHLTLHWIYSVGPEDSRNMLGFLKLIFCKKISFCWTRWVTSQNLIQFLFFFLSPTGMGQKENKFPKTVCPQTRNLHGLVTAPKPTKTTKTLLADGQPMTARGLDCEPQNHLQQQKPFFSMVYWYWFNLLASDFPAAFLFLPISWLLFN